MRKILIGVLIILLIVMASLLIFKGLSIANFKILSVQQIIDKNDKLTNEIEQTELLMYSTFRTKTDELDKNVTNLLTAKNEYLDLASVSTEAELSKANTKETYTVEFLWTRLGRHATAEGVNLECALSSNSTTGLKNIEFTVIGNYNAIIDFVAAIEDDSKLGFRIENFKLVPNGDSLKATFVTRNINVKIEDVTSSNTDSSLTRDKENDSTAKNNTNKDNTNTSSNATNINEKQTNTNNEAVNTENNQTNINNNTINTENTNNTTNITTDVTQ